MDLMSSETFCPRPPISIFSRTLLGTAFAQGSLVAALDVEFPRVDNQSNSSIVSTLIQCNIVASTLMRRCLNVMCPFRCSINYVMVGKFISTSVLSDAF